MTLDNEWTAESRHGSENQSWRDRFAHWGRWLGLIAITGLTAIPGCGGAGETLLKEIQNAAEEANRGSQPTGGSLPGGTQASGMPVSMRTAGPGSTAPIQVMAGGSVPQRTNETLLIASFNIQVFGESKAKTPAVMEYLASIIRLFDVVAIQEIRSRDDRVMPTLVDYVNAAGTRYAFEVGPRLGRTNSTEQYAYVFDTTRVALTAKSYTVQDGGTDPQGRPIPDLLHREPLVANFRTLANQPFTFTLVNMHTDPDVAKQECSVLGDLLVQIRQYEQTVRMEDDVLLLGDLNAHPGEFGRLATIPGILPAIQNHSTMVKTNNLYDNIVLDSLNTREFTGRSGVLSMREAFSITVEEALKISDHNPIWAEFRPTEAPGGPQVANQVTPISR